MKIMTDVMIAQNAASAVSFPEFTRNFKLEAQITKIFISAGIRANVNGFHFLREAVKQTVENPYRIINMSKQIYPEIAKIFNTTVSNVEKSMRHAIENAWNRGANEFFTTLFGVCVYRVNEKPTNSEFIMLIADKMLLEGI